MPTLRSLTLSVVLGTTLNMCLAAAPPATGKADAPATAPPPAAAAESKRAVMSGEQVVEILDETVSWYRTLGAQEQSATQPSDLLILYANRQTADKVINLAFGIARANAELLSSDAEIARKDDEANSSPQALQRVQVQLEARRTALQTAIGAAQRQIATGPAKEKAEVEARLAELQSELDLVNARRNFVGTMSQFMYQSDANGSGASALKEHIDAIAASIPSFANSPAPASGGTSSATSTAPSTTTSNTVLTAAADNNPRRLGIWDLGSNVLKLRAKLRTIDDTDQRTAALQETFERIRKPPLEKIKALSDRGDQLASDSGSAGTQALNESRSQFDTLAWLFKQTAAILVPLSQEGVLLDQYRRNLKAWRETVEGQFRNALRDLGIRVGILVALLALVFGGAELWRRTVFRYVQEPRRRYQFLLVRKIVMWALVVSIIGFTFATELSSLVTFAGLITAGLAVAMQSVLVSFVGYFFLIGKYGIRVGDRVQIGNVTGEVIELGLVRLHLMELSTLGPLGPTGRVVAFANSIVFQASGGIFKQIPGVNLSWHDITLKLPAVADYTALKERLFEAANRVLADYHDDFAQQNREIQKTSASHEPKEVQAQVQLRFSIENVEATVRYPVQLQRASEIDERISRELLNVIRSAPPALTDQRA